MDAFDFFSVSVTLTRLRAQFVDKTINDLSESITLTLLFRSVGAFGFGIITDRFGRRWPLAFNLICIAILALSTGFVNTFSEFLAVRALFGIMMGGIYGMAAGMSHLCFLKFLFDLFSSSHLHPYMILATALENLPSEARGLFSGLLQVSHHLPNPHHFDLTSSNDDEFINPSKDMPLVTSSLPPSISLLLLIPITGDRSSISEPDFRSWLQSYESYVPNLKSFSTHVKKLDNILIHSIDQLLESIFSLLDRLSLYIGRDLSLRCCSWLGLISSHMVHKVNYDHPLSLYSFASSLAS